MMTDEKKELTEEKIPAWWTRPPNEGDQLVELVKSQLPEVVAEIRVPDSWDKRWFVDFRYQKRWVVVEWTRVRHPDKFAGFGISLNTEDTVYGEGPDYVNPTMAAAAVLSIRLLTDAIFAEKDKVLEGLFDAWLFIADTSTSWSCSEDFKVVRCFHCDEFMMEAVWPAHGNPKCPAKQAMDSVWAGIKAFAEHDT